MKKLEIVKTEARKIHIKKALLDLNFRYMNIISLVAFIAMVYGIIRNQNVISDDTAIINNLDYIIIPLLIWFVFTLIVYFTSGAHVSDMFSEVLEVMMKRLFIRRMRQKAAVIWQILRVMSEYMIL